MSVILQDRLEAVRGIPLSVSNHPEPSGDDAPGAFCAMEKYAYITGERWTDNPDNCSHALSAFIRRFQDNTDQACRDRLDAWMEANADRIAATAGDQFEDARGFLAADWCARVALPLWLDLAGAPKAAEALRTHAPITDRSSAGVMRTMIQKTRKEAKLPDWWTWRSELRQRVRDAVKKYAQEHPVPGAAWAAWAAGAAGAAEAAGAAGAARDRVYRLVREKFLEKWGARFAPTRTSLQESAFDLLEHMVTVGEGQLENAA